MPEHDETTAADAGEAINDIRRFVWAAADVTEAQEKVAARLDKVRAAFEGTRERLEAAAEQAQRLARHGLTIDKSDMDAVRADRIALTEALRDTIGQAEAIREKFWTGALLIGIAGGVIGGGVAVATPYIIRGFMS